MKKNQHFAFTILAVGALHAVGIFALSSFETKPAELVTTQEELTFVDLGSEAPAAAMPVAAVVEPVQPPVAAPEIKRTIVKKPTPETVTERKPDPKITPKPKPEPKVDKVVENKPEKKIETVDKPQPNPSANNQQAATSSSQSSGNSNQTNATGTGKGNGKESSGAGTGSGNGSNEGGGGPTVGVKVAGSTNCLKPDYPQESIDRGETGAVKVRWTVGADGGVLNVDVTGPSSHTRLNNAALRQAKKCKFTPALKGGVPVQNTYSRTYTFKL